MENYTHANKRQRRDRRKVQGLAMLELPNLPTASDPGFEFNSSSSQHQRSFFEPNPSVFSRYNTRSKTASDPQPFSFKASKGVPVPDHAMADRFMYKPGRFYSAPSHQAASLATPRKVSRTIQPPGQAELACVKEYLCEVVTGRASSRLRCPHLPVILSMIFAAIRADDHKIGVSYTQGNTICVAECSECEGGICLGCGRKIIVQTWGEPTVDTVNQSMHKCTESHLISIILVLAKLDVRWRLQNYRSPSQQTPLQTAWFPDEDLEILEGLAGRAWKAGVGYGTGEPALSHNKSKIPGQTKQEANKKLNDSKPKLNDRRQFADLLTRLAELLQDKAGHNAVSGLIIEKGNIVASFMKVSYLPELIRSLVLEESLISIEENGNREVYSSCLLLFRIFADYESLFDILVSALPAKESSPGIAGMVDSHKWLAPSLKGMLTRKELASMKKTEDVDFTFVIGLGGITQSILRSFDTLVTQCKACLSNASRVVTFRTDQEVDDLIEFCTNVEATSIKLNQAADNRELKKAKSRVVSTASTNSHLASLSPEILAHPLFARSNIGASTSRSTEPLDIPRDIQLECREALASHLQFKFSSAVVDTHCRAQLHDGIGTVVYKKLHGIGVNAPAPSNPGRMKHLIKDLSVLSTALPEGVFVRVQEDRPDLFKALIVGAGSTPYQLGLYEFDFTIPQSYPTEPPLVTFKTTGGGVVRFNPNLYANGMVCLSILGTWPGGTDSEEWQPGKSTLLQILVSIQALVLCSEPYYNEPGFDAIPDSDASKLYNEQVQLNSIRTAMIDWLGYKGIWEDIVHAHFLANTVAVLSKTLEFVAEANEMDSAQHARLWGWGDVDVPTIQPYGLRSDAEGPTTFRKTMQNTRNDLETKLKEKLPGFLRAGLWREKTEAQT
ncbi:hypothetical protein Dda_8349 [Drechslerella dactyloides]|uniref:UBC core domain-containing protein n=1 Tax=Drechslerella dactyloides TaxID=74499 RepID=A0AAD6IQI0_DREDA|nr:hypothetical protein Dda_8349 [Drechslerella dactyloides]